MSGIHRPENCALKANKQEFNVFLEDLGELYSAIKLSETMLRQLQNKEEYDLLYISYIDSKERYNMLYDEAIEALAMLTIAWPEYREIYKALLEQEF